MDIRTEPLEIQFDPKPCYAGKAVEFVYQTEHNQTFAFHGLRIEPCYLLLASLAIRLPGEEPIEQLVDEYINSLERRREITTLLNETYYDQKMVGAFAIQLIEPNSSFTIQAFNASGQEVTVGCKLRGVLRTKVD